MLKKVNLKDVKTLYIASDSPTSQYRNKIKTFLTKKWAMDNEIQVFWIYTETGHGKGPMDGVGAAVKKSIKDTLAYNPDKVIRNTEQLMQYLPDSNIIITTYNQNDVEKNPIRCS